MSQEGFKVLKKRKTLNSRGREHDDPSHTPSSSFLLPHTTVVVPVCFITVAFEKKNQEKDALFDDDDLAKARQLFSQRGGKELSRRDARDDDTQQKSTRDGAERRDVDDVPLFFIKAFCCVFVCKDIPLGNDFE